MDPILLALALAVPPGLGCVLAGLLAEVVPVSRRTIGLALHVAAGFVLAVVSVELLPRAFEADAPWITVLAFALGGGLFILLDHLTETAADRFADDGDRRLVLWRFMAA